MSCLTNRLATRYIKLTIYLFILSLSSLKKHVGKKMISQKHNTKM